MKEKKMKQTGITLKTSTFEKLDKLAEVKDRSRNYLMRKFIERGLAEVENEKTN